MARVELTDKFIKSCKVEARTDFTDAKSAGLMINVYPSGQKTFAFWLRGPDGKRQGSIIGHYGNISLSDAKVAATELRKRLKAGEDITAAGQKAIAAEAAALEANLPTLQELIIEYESIMSTKRKTWSRTVNDKGSEARWRIEPVFKPHLSTRVNDIGLEDLPKR